MAPSLESVKTLAENEKNVFLEASTLLMKIIGNILRDPHNEKYRRMRIANPTLSAKLLPVDGAFQCLFEMGFEEADDHLELPKSSPLEQLRLMQQELQLEMDKIQKFSSAAHSSAQGVPNVSARAPSQQTSSRAEVRHNNNVFQTEAKFFLRLQSSMTQVELYEDSQRQAKARATIPLADLEQKAKRKFESLETSVGGPGIQDLLLLELLAWFKRDFFKWVNQPECLRCGGETSWSDMASPTAEELRYGAQRVENYRCGVRGCAAYTRFPRYNDPAKLLETRRGRCGEWANCFTLCCRSLGFEARYVLDWTDHVWTEVYSQSQRRWLHCDPCENACDKPLVYEVGWKKKLSYVIAFSKDDVQDVTWRYSCKHKDLLSRRRECRETWLVHTIVKLRQQLQQRLEESRRQELKERLLTELIEFLSVKTASEAESQGRLSGSAAWRIARGEIGDISAATQGPSSSATGSGRSSNIIVATGQEIRKGALHLQYCCSTDSYSRASESPDTKVHGWQSLVYECQGIFRKEEHDWNMVYLARREGTDEASISWKFKVDNAVIGSVEVKAESKCYENGRISWRLCSGEDENAKCAMLPSDGRLTVLEDFSGCDSLTLTAVLSLGRGDVAWQHTQLFRQGLGDSSNPLDIKIHLKSSPMQQ